MDTAYLKGTENLYTTIATVIFPMKVFPFSIPKYFLRIGCVASLKNILHIKLKVDWCAYAFPIW